MRNPIVISGLFVILAVPGLSPLAEEPRNVDPDQELIAQPADPVLENITVRLEGTQQEAEFLKTVEKIIQELLAEAKLDVDQTFVPNEMADSPVTTTRPAAVNRRITLELDADVAQPPYEVAIAVENQDIPERDRVVKVFYYDPDNPATLREALKGYLKQTLNIVFPEEQKKQSPSSEQPSQGQALPPGGRQPLATANRHVVATASSTSTEPEAVNPQLEGHLVYEGGGKSSYKNINISIEGNEQVGELVAQLQKMVKNLLARARPRDDNSVRRYLNIQVKWNEQEGYAPLLVTVDSVQNTARMATFRYYPNKPQQLERELADYLEPVLNADIPAPH